MATRVFLFTDIEGSTHLWSEFPHAMPAVLAQHDSLVSAAIEAARGQIFKHTGDGICATFSTVTDAIRAAISAQRAITAGAWGAPGELRVRMAIHVGEAEPRGDDWFGPGLNRTARLMGIAHGGQIVVSSPAMALANDAPGLGFGATDLGVHRLRDLAATERVWQIVADGLSREFPPLRSLGGFRGNLPSQLTAFLGRESDLDVVINELLSRRLVSLVGPGGVGKTRLALQSAASVVEKFPEGVWFVELAALSDPTALDHAVAATIGLVPRHGYTPTELVLDVLRDWRALIVIDNCEHLLACAASLIHRLLTTASDVVVLATSREPLHVPGEHVNVVRPLPIDTTAVDLFNERATAANPGFAGHSHDRDAVIAVCRRLDGIPLAIELAAARMRSMTATELVGRLDQRFRLLSNERGVGGVRHRSLQAALDWSFDLLPEDERRFFTRLSIFAASFDLDAAHAVAGDDVGDELATLDYLDALVDKSLVTADQLRVTTRYGLLETMRQYGADHLTPHDIDDLRLRHARYFAAFTERAWLGMRGPDDMVWVTFVEESLDDIRTAMQTAVALGDTDLALRIIAALAPYNMTRRKPEIWAWAASAVALPGADDHPLVVQAYLALSHGGHAQDQEMEAEQRARQAAARHAALGLPPDPQLGIHLLYGLAFLGRLDEARAVIRESLAILDAQRAGDTYDRVEALHVSTILSMYEGAADIESGETCLASARVLGNTWMQARACLTLGLALGPSDPERGRGLLEEAVALCRQPDYPYWVGSTVLFVATAYADTDPAEGLRRLAGSLDEYRATGARQWVRRTLRDFMTPFAALGHFDAVALIDGASKPVSSRPAATSAAKDLAIDRLGQVRYEELRVRGAQLADDELSDRLRQEIDVALAGARQ